MKGQTDSSDITGPSIGWESNMKQKGMFRLWAGEENI